MSPSRTLRINATFARRQNPVAGFVGALLIHATIIAGALFTFAHKLDIVDQSPPIVAVDLVQIGKKTNIAPTITKRQKIEAEKEVEQPTPTPPPTPVTPPKQEEAPPPPKPAPPEPKKEEEAPPEDKPVVVLKKPEPKPEPVVKAAAPAPAKPEQSKKKFDINNVMAMLDNQQSKAAAPNAKVAKRSQRGFGEQSADTADLSTALASQIMACWSPPVGAPNGADLVVDFDLFLNQDGSVARPPQLVGNSASDVARSPYTRAAAEAARRAIYTCAPYKLPANRYSDWQEINPFHFDPRQMMGQ
ncbi:MAG TPA: hypothetical protein VGG10_11550 [Rhizomicrobium sp.]|jgi:outer membrane biosynthesis protein TonB